MAASTTLSPSLSSSLVSDSLIQDDNDTVYFAHCFPYSYSDLVRYLSKLAIPANRNIVRKVTLAKTTAGNK